MKLLKSKMFWMSMSGVNVMSGMICAFCGSFEGTLICIFSLGACMISYNLTEHM